MCQRQHGFVLKENRSPLVCRLPSIGKALENLSHAMPTHPNKIFHKRFESAFGGLGCWDVWCLKERLASHWRPRGIPCIPTHPPKKVVLVEVGDRARPLPLRLCSFILVLTVKWWERMVKRTRLGAQGQVDAPLASASWSVPILLSSGTCRDRVYCTDKDERRWPSLFLRLPCSVYCCDAKYVAALCIPVLCSHGIDRSQCAAHPVPTSY